MSDKKQEPRQYITYRGAGKLSDRLQEAFRHFYSIVRELPLSVMVHHDMRDDTALALDALKLKHVPVTTCGGCLRSEIWLQAPPKFDLDSIRAS